METLRQQSRLEFAYSTLLFRMRGGQRRRGYQGPFRQTELSFLETIVVGGYSVVVTSAAAMVVHGGRGGRGNVDETCGRLWAVKSVTASPVLCHPETVALLYKTVTNC
jgi:hypothetical protein